MSKNAAVGFEAGEGEQGLHGGRRGRGRELRKEADSGNVRLGAVKRTEGSLVTRAW